MNKPFFIIFIITVFSLFSCGSGKGDYSDTGFADNLEIKTLINDSQCFDSDSFDTFSDADSPVLPDSVTEDLPSDQAQKKDGSAKDYSSYFDASVISKDIPCGYGSVTGTICDAENKAYLDNAKVYVDTSDCDGNPFKMQTFTDSKGKFTLSVVPSGSQIIHAEKGESVLTFQINVDPGEVNDITKVTIIGCKDTDRCYFGDITGQVCYYAGMPKTPSTKVFVDTKDCDENPVYQETETDKDGIFSLSEIPEGQQIIHITNGKVNEEYQVSVVADTMTFVGFIGKKDCECQFGDIKGKVCWYQGMLGIGSTKIFVDSSDCDNEKIFKETATDASGNFILTGLPEGEQILHVENLKFKDIYNVTVVKKTVTDTGFLGPVTCTGCGFGKVCGYVCAPNGTYKIGGAKVYVNTSDCAGKPVNIETLSDSNGNYCLDNVPAGNQTVNVEKGSFKTQYSLPVSDGSVINAQDIIEPTKLCFPKSSVKIAVVTGNWDAIQNIISKLGFTYDLYDGVSNPSDAINFLSNFPKMKTYSVIFFNCGANHDYIISNGSIVSNLTNYVQQGGSIYASDWAFVYVEDPWPLYVSYYGKFGDSETLNGTVVDPELASILGKSTVAINYNLVEWVVVDSVSGNTSQHISGWTPEIGKNAPWLMSFKPFSTGGRVLYTTFHNEFQVTADMEKILQALVFMF
jgi:uncharacterized protein (DUF2249 family)